jgi:penicillin-binding protein A
MPFARETHRIVIGFIIAFTLVTLVAGFWAITGSETVLVRQDNPRLLEDRARVLRGEIFDRNSEPLVTSTISDNGRIIRDNLYPAMYSALGYRSLTYGASMAEAAYNDILTGDTNLDTVTEWLQYDLLHQRREGQDVQLTLDLNIQQAAADALGDHQGAIVVLSVPDGGVVALISQPTINPDTLNDDWQTLISAEEALFFNRALQGNYQPGGTFYTVLILTALLENFPGDTAFADAMRSVTIPALTLDCIIQPPADTLTLFDAFAFGCPAPFADFAEQIGYEAIQKTLRLIRPEDAPTLPSYTILPGTQDAPPAPPEAVNTPETAAFDLEDALGQGEFLTTPLEMATFVASFINNGNAPQPYTLHATRPTHSTTWQNTPRILQSTPITTAENARRIVALLRQNVARGTAQAAARPNLDIGGQVALGYIGTTSHAWFIGFLRVDARDGYAITVLLEDSDDLQRVAQIAGDILAAAAN